MVNLKTTKVKRQWIHPLNGLKNIAEIRVSKRGTKYFCIYLTLGSMWPRPVKELRLSVLKDAAVWLAEMAEANNMPNDWLEDLLDHIYAELNRRMNKS